MREILLDNVQATEESYDEYPDEQCYGRELPTLDSRDYSGSENLVKQMITPPPKFHTAVVLWSKLRVLTLSPDKEDLSCLQPILDAACNTLEELYLTNRENLRDNLSAGQFSGCVNLGNLSCLRVFAFRSVINYGRCSLVNYGQKTTDPRDINLVLITIPISGQVTNLTFDFGRRNCLEKECRETSEPDFRWNGV